MTLKTGMSRPNSPIIWLQKFRTPMTQSLKELLAAKAALDMEIAKARTSAADAALSKVQKLVTDFGFTQQQVFPYIPEKTSAPAKYRDPATGATDRKSTRLNSSHVRISYAVFCLKKKKQTVTKKYVFRSSYLSKKF